MSSRLLHPPRRRPGVEIVRHPEGPIEIKLSGLVGALEQRTRRWRRSPSGGTTSAEGRFSCFVPSWKSPRLGRAAGKRSRDIYPRAPRM